MVKRAAIEPQRIVTASAALRRLREDADPARARHLARFFKTGKGDYAEGDRFLGLTVPMTRAIARTCVLDGEACDALLDSELHEARLLALVVMTRDFARGEAATRRGIYDRYLARAHRINNWDLVDVSADPIVGGYLVDKSRKPLHALVKSPLLWERRIAIIATFHFIKNRESAETLALAKKLLGDGHDLIHKAVGWMLREVGKRCSEIELTTFLDEHAPAMPRTALRYSIEHLSPTARAHYMGLPRTSA